MAIDVKQYVTELAKSVGVADDKLQAALEVIGNEKVSKAISDGFLRQEDYSRNMDGLRSEKDKLSKWYEEQLRVAQNNEKVVTETNARLSKYQELYGNIEDGTSASRSSVDTSNFLSKKEFEEALQRQGQQFIAVTKTATKCSADYMKRFGEVLDMDALEKFTIDSGLPLAAAYDKYIEPRVQELNNKSFEQKLKEAEERGRTEGLSQRDNPTDTGKPGPGSAFLGHLKAQQGPTGVRDGFVEEWNKATKQ